METLKRDWSSTLKLRDVLVTISCLLIQPNPASALNEDAGKLATEDWEGFCRRARLMTNIHAAIPASIAKEVKEAQMRGEDVPLEAGPVQTEMKKGKERVKITPTTSKVQRPAAEDEENILQRRAETQDPPSDPESDWIPGPDKTPRPAPTRRDNNNNNNIFGITGLATPPKPISISDPDDDEKENHDTSDPFITVPSSKRSTIPTRVQLPTSSSLATTNTTPITTDHPSHLRFASQNPYTALQPASQTHPLFTEFSYSWDDATVLHSEGNEVRKMEVRKRLAGREFEGRREWELKRFRRVGGDLGRWNRGEWVEGGKRVGMGRL